jgi:hypothetical protein
VFSRQLGEIVQDPQYKPLLSSPLSEFLEETNNKPLPLLEVLSGQGVAKYGLRFIRSEAGLCRSVRVLQVEPPNTGGREFVRKEGERVLASLRGELFSGCKGAKEVEREEGLPESRPPKQTRELPRVEEVSEEASLGREGPGGEFLECASLQDAPRLLRFGEVEKEVEVGRVFGRGVL